MHASFDLRKTLISAGNLPEVKQLPTPMSVQGVSGRRDTKLIERKYFGHGVDNYMRIL